MKLKLGPGSQELKTLEQFDSCLEDIDNVVIGTVLQILIES